MPAKTPKEAFLMLLSHVRQGTEREQQFTTNSATWPKTHRSRRL
jgi:hypothetical protein